MTRDDIRTAYTALATRLAERRRVDWRDRDARSRYERTTDALRTMLLEVEGGNVEVVDALFAEWDINVRELCSFEQRQRQEEMRDKKRKLEERLREKYEADAQVYLWCRCEGWFSEGPFKQLILEPRGNLIKNENGDRVAWWDEDESCWRTQKGGGMRIVDPPVITNSNRHPK